MKIMPVVKNVYQKWTNLESLERGVIAASTGVMLLAGAAVVRNNNRNNNNIAKCEEYMNAQANYNKANIAADNPDTLDLQKYLQ